MHRGEITGHFYDVTTADIGMPFRPEVLTRKQERKYSSHLDQDILDKTNNDELKHNDNFEYYDPSILNYSHTGGERQLRPRRELYETPRKIKNISSFNTDYLNTIAFNIFNEINKKTYSNFCVCPIGILNSLIENDSTINEIISELNTSEIFYQQKNYKNCMISRASVILKTSVPITNITCYDNNEISIMEFPMNNKNFAYGMIMNKNEDEIFLTNKNFTGFISNLKYNKLQLYCPNFSVSNKLYLNNTLNTLGYINDNLQKYLQTIYFKLSNKILCSTKSSKYNLTNNNIDFSGNKIFYVRYVPNNVVLFIGKHMQI